MSKKKELTIRTIDVNGKLVEINFSDLVDAFTGDACQVYTDDDGVVHDIDEPFSYADADPSDMICTIMDELINNSDGSDEVLNGWLEDHVLKTVKTSIENNDGLTDKMVKVYKVLNKEVIAGIEPVNNYGW